MKRKIRQTIFDRSIVYASLIAFLGLTGRFCLGQTSNIIDKSDLNNKLVALNFNNYSDGSSESLQSTNPAIDLGIKIPQTPPLIVKRNEFPIPFNLASQNAANPPTDVELLYANVQNPVWTSYGKISAGSAEKAFLFKAPQNGEFAFVLKTNFKDGDFRLSPVVKINIMNANAADVDQSSVGAKNSSPPETENVASDSESPTIPLPLPSRSGAVESSVSPPYSSLAPLKDSSNAQTDGANSSSSTESSEDVEAFPGAIRSVGCQDDPKNGGTFIVVRWVRPEDIGQKSDDGGLVQLERSASLDGRWEVVANQLDSNEQGYQWKATAYDSTPFYLRTITRDPYGKDWTYVFPQLIDLSARLKFDGDSKSGSNGDSATKTTANDSDSAAASGSKNGSAGSAANDSTSGSTDDFKIGLSNLSLPLDSPDDADRPRSVSAWVDSPDLPTPGESSGTNDGSGNSSDDSKTETEIEKTSSVSTSSTASNESPRKLFDISAPQAAPRTRPIVPPPTNPGEFSVNPLFTQGIGVIFQAQQARNPNGYIENPTATQYYGNQTNGGTETASNKTPEPPRRRSIFALFNKQQESQIIPQETIAQNSTRNIPTTGYNVPSNVFPPGLRSATAQDGSPVYYDDGNGNLVDASGVRIDVSKIGQDQIPPMVNGMPTIPPNGTIPNAGQIYSQNGSLDSSPNAGYNGTNGYFDQNYSGYSNYSDATEQGLSLNGLNQSSGLPLQFGEYPQGTSYQNAPIDNQYSRDYPSGTGSIPSQGTSPLPNTRSVLPPKPSIR